jgi:hypothetical protein
MNMEEMICTLPGGWVDAKGEVHREVIFSPLTGREEALLADNKQNRASQVTAILNRCIRRIGTVAPVSESIVHNLLIADRDFLLLKLREATFGSRVQATIPCPWPDCGEKVDIDFLIDDIPVISSVEKGPLFTMSLSPQAAFLENEETYRELVFRLPIGADQELLSPRLVENESLALAELLAQCIQRIGPVEIASSAQIERLSPLARMEIEQEMLRLAPKIELNMDVNCPECRRIFTAPFDLQDFFFGEMRTSRDLLYREVHYLAYHYHWSEKEIMEMPKDQRRNYIEILADEIERLNNAV